MTEAEKRKAIDLALAAMDKQFGKGSVLRLGNHLEREGGLAGGFGAEYFGDTSARDSTHAHSRIQRKAAR